MDTYNFNLNEKRFENQSDMERDKRIQNNSRWFFSLVMIFPDLVAIFFGYVAWDYYLHPSGTANWLVGSFFLAICAGLIIRYLLKDIFGGHIGITIASVIVALAVSIFALILVGTFMPFIVYLVLFTFAICA